MLLQCHYLSNSKLYLQHHEKNVIRESWMITSLYKYHCYDALVVLPAVRVSNGVLSRNLKNEEAQARFGLLGQRKKIIQ